MARPTKFRVSEDDEDWAVVREIFIESYFEYPLYKHMARNPHTRREFLKRYFDANYSASCRNGNALFLCLELTMNLEDKGNNRKIVGGMIMDPPSKDMSLQADEQCWKAYADQKLPELFPEEHCRLVEYERWERKAITDRMTDIDVPVWNGLFLAIAPNYTSLGIGESLKSSISQHLYKLSMKNDTTLQEKAKISFMKYFQMTSLLSRHSFPPAATKRISKTPTKKQPIILIITHNKRSSGFWQVRGGCKMISQLNYSNRHFDGLIVDVLGCDLFNAATRTVHDVCEAWNTQDSICTFDSNNNVLFPINFVKT